MSPKRQLPLRIPYSAGTQTPAQETLVRVPNPQTPAEETLVRIPNPQAQLPLIYSYSSKVVDFLQRQLLPWAWTTVLKVLEGVLVQYLSNNVGGAVWNKLWRALKTWMNW